MKRAVSGGVNCRSKGRWAWHLGGWSKEIPIHDADDVSLPDRLVKQVEYLDGHPNVVVVGGGARFLVEGKSRAETINPPFDQDQLLSLLERENALVHPTALLRRRAVLQVGGYRRAFRYAQDYDLWLRLAEIGRLANIADIVLEYRISPEQIAFRHLEDSLLAKLGARTCAEFRRAGRSDPAPVDGVIDRSWLLRHGWNEAEVDGTLLSAYVDRAWWLTNIGMFNAAERLVGDLGRLNVVPTLVRSHRFRWRWESARVAWSSKRRMTAAVRFASACAGSPVLGLRRLAALTGRRLRATPRQLRRRPVNNLGE